MLFSILSGGDIFDIIISLLLTVPIILISLSLHEAAHGYMAMKMGDRTAYNLGRVTINPAKHLDPIGSLCMLVFGYGWAKPVPINTRNFKDPKTGMAFTAIAGPVTNILLGIVGVLLYSVSIFAFNSVFMNPNTGDFLVKVTYILCTFFYNFAYMNFLLAAFNLIPVPPFDGSRFFALFIPAKTYFAMMRYERQLMLAVLFGMMACSQFFGFSPFGWIAERATDSLSLLLFRLWSIIFA